VTSLVWVPADALAALKTVHERLEVRAMPAEPLNDPRLGEVEVLVPPMRTNLDSLEDVLPRAEVLVVLLPLTPATRGLVDRRVLALLPDGALLINAARGQVVDTDALQGELRVGRLRAFLDVTEPEPLPPGHFLYSAPGAFLTPHIAGWTEGLGVQSELVAGQLKRYANAEPLINVVEDGY
jgi:phosphoglycerate dehydrogenase-like enzyme